MMKPIHDDLDKPYPAEILAGLVIFCLSEFGYYWIGMLLGVVILVVGYILAISEREIYFKQRRDLGQACLFWAVVSVVSTPYWYFDVELRTKGGVIDPLSILSLSLAHLLLFILLHLYFVIKK